MQSIRVIYTANPLKFEHNFVSFKYVKNPQPLNVLTFQSTFWQLLCMHIACWLDGWGLTALLTRNRSYRACRFVGIFYSKL